MLSLFCVAYFAALRNLYLFKIVSYITFMFNMRSESNVQELFKQWYLLCLSKMNCIALKWRLHFGFYRFIGAKESGADFLNKVELRKTFFHMFSVVLAIRSRLSNAYGYILTRLLIRILRILFSIIFSQTHKHSHREHWLFSCFAYLRISWKH